MVRIHQALKSNMLSLSFLLLSFVLTMTTHLSSRSVQYHLPLPSFANFLIFHPALTEGRSPPLSNFPWHQTTSPGSWPHKIFNKKISYDSQKSFRSLHPLASILSPRMPPSCLISSATRLSQIRVFDILSHIYFSPLLRPLSLCH